MMVKDDAKEAIIPCKAKIEDFPSRGEVLQLLDDLIANNKYKKDYYCDNKDNCIIISFKDSNIAFEFLKVINIQKAKHSLYANVKTSLIFDDKSRKSNADGKSQPQTKTLNKKEVTKGSKLKYKTNNEPRQLNTEPSYSSQLKRNNQKKNGDIYSQRSSILISDPYIDPSDMKYAEYVKNKSKWISPNGFKPYVNEKKTGILKEIGTYVTRTPSNVSYLNFRYRDVNKSKWVSTRNFEFKHISDLE